MYILLDTRECITMTSERRFAIEMFETLQAVIMF